MTVSIDQHQSELLKNLELWRSKPLLQQIYAGFYARIRELINPAIPGRIVEVGAGIGNLKTYLPEALATDLFPNPWIDVVCSAYKLPFEPRSVSHLILFDVFHHLEAPAAFFAEAARVLVNGGRVVMFEPYISLTSFGIYGLFHHEPIAWRSTINLSKQSPAENKYYASQGNATRLFFGKSHGSWPEGFSIFHREAIASFAYLLSGGYSKPALYPGSWLPTFQRLDQALSRWPKLLGSRCLIGLEKAA